MTQEDALCYAFNALRSTQTGILQQPLDKHGPRQRLGHLLARLDEPLWLTSGMNWTSDSAVRLG
jgi:transposase